MKRNVWGFDVAGDAVCYSAPFVREQGNLLNVDVGGRKIIVQWDDDYESLGIWYNDFDSTATEMDFFGRSDLGQHKRVEHVKAGLFYAMWLNFYPSTDVNRAI